MSGTHEVTNQVPPLIGRDIAAHPALLEGLRREGAGWAEDEVHALGRLAGTEQAQEWGRLANEHPPVLRTHDRYGNRIDEVEYQPAYHELMRTAVEHGLHGAPWADERAGRTRRPGREGPGLGRGRRRPPLPDLDDLRGGAGAACRPGSGRRLRTAADQPRVRPRAAGPADQARPDRRHVDDREAGRLGRPRQHHARRGGADGSYRLTGHKWFTSAPMSDLFLTLAQAPGGLSCFLVPRVLPDGTPQRVLPAAAQGQARQQVQRLGGGRVRGRRRAGWSARRAAASARSSRW